MNDHHEVTTGKCSLVAHLAAIVLQRHLQLQEQNIKELDSLVSVPIDVSYCTLVMRRF